MKVIAQTAALQEALTLASSIVAQRTPKPVLQCVKLLASGKTLTLLATDLEAGCRCVVTQVEVKAEGEALVPVQKFADIVRESGGEESLTLTVEKEACHITGAGARFRLLGYDPAEYPEVADFTDDGDFQVPAAVLAELTERTLFAAARAHSHYAISGVLWEATGRKLQLVATDGHRLALAKASLPKAAGREVAAIVPAKLMALLGRSGVAADDEMLAVKVTESQILVRSARAVLLSNLVQGNFPKYSDVIPKEAAYKAKLETQLFTHRIRQAALLTSEDSRSVRLAFGPEVLTITSRSAEAGEAELTMPVEFRAAQAGGGGEPFEIAFNPAFLIDALKVAEAEEVSFEFSAPNKPAVLKAGSEFLYVVMPVDLG
ncbi:MAG: DNA polymerase III subunit beta [Planctomycetales bacterium 4484_123]|nr:MAG: DNA polymerase III subunit beta [Planctomycetales bacterium 4484_123]